MALKFQYNKTTIQELRKQLSIRKKALPILQNKETALRKEVKERQEALDRLKVERDKIKDKVVDHKGLWTELPQMVFLKERKILWEQIIGVKIPNLEKVEFDLVDISWWNYPAWMPSGINILMNALKLEIKIEVLKEQIDLLDQARKKTIQKVNLYEKVQIPEMDAAIMKIKRFLEDKENIAKAGQKIMKKRNERREVV